MNPVLCYRTVMLVLAKCLKFSPSLLHLLLLLSQVLRLLQTMCSSAGSNSHSSSSSNSRCPSSIFSSCNSRHLSSIISNTSGRQVKRLWVPPTLGMHHSLLSVLPSRQAILLRPAWTGASTLGPWGPALPLSLPEQDQPTTSPISTCGHITMACLLPTCKPPPTCKLLLRGLKPMGLTELTALKAAHHAKQSSCSGHSNLQATGQLALLWHHRQAGQGRTAIGQGRQELLCGPVLAFSVYR